METKANHVLVGLFALVITIASFAFVYWLARLDETTNRTPVYVVFDDSVTGLNTGSSVLYNGIKVGEVSSLEILRGDPTNLVRALLRVDAMRTPLKTDTKAQLEYQGLTGVAAIQLSGGSFGAPDLVAEEGRIPVIRAEKGQFQDLMEAGRAIVTRASDVIDRIDRILGDNEQTLTTTLKNVETFTGSLARNSENIDKIFSDASQLADRLNGMASSFDGLSQALQSLAGDGAGELFSSIGSTFRRLDTFLTESGPDLQQTVANLQQFTSTLATNREDFEGFIKDARTTASRLNTVSEKLDTLIVTTNDLIGGGGADLVRSIGATFERLDGFLAENGPGLQQTVANLEQFTTTLNANRTDIEGFIKDARTTATNLTGVSAKLDTLVDRANEVLSGDTGTLVEDASGVFRRLQTFLATNEEALGKTINNVEKFTGALSENSDDISTMLQDAGNLAAKLSKTSDDINALVARVDGLVAGDGTEFVTEAKKAAQTFRQLAENLDERIGTATEGLNRVTGRGFKEFETFLVEGRSTLRDLKRILERMERNPQRFFFGRAQVPEYRPR